MVKRGGRIGVGLVERVDVGLVEGFGDIVVLVVDVWFVFG